VSLEQILRRRSDIWRGKEGSPGEEPNTLATGHPDLDTHLPGGGWPRGTLVEIYPEHPGIGELRLLLPTLAQLSQGGRWLAWVGAPHVPYAPALASAGIRLSRVLVIQPASPGDGLWALEQTLRCGACGAVLAWTTQETPRSLRRLQLAAEEGNCLGFLYRSPASVSQPSPAALRIRLEHTSRGLGVQILKCRGWAPVPFVVDLSAQSETSLQGCIHGVSCRFRPDIYSDT
jgi:hypothetical protein